MKEERGKITKSPGPVPGPGREYQHSVSSCRRFKEQSQDLGCADGCSSGGLKIDFRFHGEDYTM